MLLSGAPREDHSGIVFCILGLFGCQGVYRNEAGRLGPSSLVREAGVVRMILKRSAAPPLGSVKVPARPVLAENSCHPRLVRILILRQPPSRRAHASVGGSYSG
jgi:hypothetical protein